MKDKNFDAALKLLANVARKKPEDMEYNISFINGETHAGTVVKGEGVTDGFYAVQPSGSTSDKGPTFFEAQVSLLLTASV